MVAKGSHVNQWNRIENSETDPHKYAQPIFDQDAKAIQQKKDNLFKKQCWSNWTSRGKKLNVELNLTPYRKTNYNELERDQDKPRA